MKEEGGGGKDKMHIPSIERAEMTHLLLII